MKGGERIDSIINNSCYIVANLYLYSEMVYQNFVNLHQGIPQYNNNK